MAIIQSIPISGDSSGSVKLVGDQTAEGVKTFTDGIISKVSYNTAETVLGVDYYYGFNINNENIKFYGKGETNGNCACMSTLNSDGSNSSRLEVCSNGNDNSITWNGLVKNNVIPYQNDYFNLGSTSNKWKNLYVTSINGKTPVYTIDLVTTSANGLMTKEDKTKLDGIEEGANNYVLPTAGSTLGGVKTTSTVKTNLGLTACPIISGVPYYKDTVITYSNFVKSGTTSAAGLVPAPPKTAGTTKYLCEDGEWKDISITSANNATLTIKKNNVSVGTFTANASVDKSINIEVPTKISDLVNDLDLSKYATESYVDTKVSNLVNSAPETLDTLNELASALGNDPNFATTVATQIGTKANDSDVVHKSGNETIGGAKVFSSNMNVTNTSPYYTIVTTGYTKGIAPTSTFYQGIRLYDDTKVTGLASGFNHITGGFEIEYRPDGYNRVYMACRNYDGLTQLHYQVGLSVPNDKTKSVDFSPSNNNLTLLGTSTNKWKDVNTTLLNGKTPAYADDIPDVSNFVTKQEIPNISNLAVDSDVVHKSGTETIGGTKTFGENIRVQGSYKGDEFSTNARTVLELRSNRDTENKSGIYISKFRQNRNQGEMSVTDLQALAIDVLENGVRSNEIFRFSFNGWENDVPTLAYFQPCNSNTQAYLGTTSFKWADVNTVLLNGKTPAYADDLTSKANDNDVVHLSGNETKNGELTASKFISNSFQSNTGGIQIQTKGTNATCAIFNGASAADGGGIWLYGKDSTQGSDCRIQIYNTSKSRYERVDLVDSKFIPTPTNVLDLGTSTNKWKDVYATTFNGNLVGNADTSTKATNNASGNELSNDIIKGLSVSGKVITYTKLDGSTGTLTTQDTNTTYSVATTSANGLMSSTDKTKLDGLSNYTLPTASSTLGGVKTTSTISDVSTYTACPIVNGVVYYKDTNTNTDTKVTNTLGNTTKAYLTGTTSATTNTGTQIFDSGVYLTTTAGQLHADIDFPITEAQVNEILGIS